jgi:hypothetical protein
VTIKRPGFFEEPGRALFGPCSIPHLEVVTMPVNVLRRVAAALAVTSLVALAGCGDNRPKTAAVQGTVTYKGKPVPRGTIMFAQEGATAATGEIGADGTYRLTTFRDGDGAVLGAHKVVITAMQDNSDPNAPGWTPTPASIIPTKYSSLGTTDLRAEVKDEENTFNFDLKNGRAR